MRRARVIRTVLFLLTSLVVSPVGASAQQFISTGRDTLRGLPGVEVLVEPLQPEIEREGFSSASLAANVVRQLKTAGITIYPSQRENPSPSKPYLYVHVNAAAAERGAFAVAIQVHLRQTLASLTTVSRIVNAMSWDAHDVAVMPSVLLKEDVSDGVEALVARFIADWQAVH